MLDAGRVHFLFEFRVATGRLCELLVVEIEREGLYTMADPTFLLSFVYAGGQI